MAASGANVVGHVAIENVNQLVDHRESVAVLLVGRVAGVVICGPMGTITAGTVEIALAAFPTEVTAGPGGFTGGRGVALEVVEGTVDALVVEQRLSVASTLEEMLVRFDRDAALNVESDVQIGEDLPEVGEELVAIKSHRQ